MKAEPKALILQELRTNTTYKQAFGVLKYKDNRTGDVCACALGLIGEVARQNGVEFVERSHVCIGKNDDGTVRYDETHYLYVNGVLGDSNAQLPDNVLDWLGLTRWQALDIAKRNDSRMSFKEVADYIERVF